MAKDTPYDKFRDYLEKIQDLDDDKCWFCGKNPDQIKSDFFQYMENPSEEFENLEIEDLLIMTYKMKKPVCAGCYFSIKRSPELVKEILERPEDEIW